MGEILAHKLLPKALKSCPKPNKSPNLVTLDEGKYIFEGAEGQIVLMYYQSYKHFTIVLATLELCQCLTLNHDRRLFIRLTLVIEHSPKKEVSLYNWSPVYWFEILPNKKMCNFCLKKSYRETLGRSNGKNCHLMIVTLLHTFANSRYLASCVPKNK